MKGIDEAGAGGSRGLKRSSRSLATHPTSACMYAGPACSRTSWRRASSSRPCLGARVRVRVRLPVCECVPAPAPVCVRVIAIAETAAARCWWRFAGRHRLLNLRTAGRSCSCACSRRGRMACRLIPSWAAMPWICIRSWTLGGCASLSARTWRRRKRRGPSAVPAAQHSRTPAAAAHQYFPSHRPRDLISWTALHAPPAVVPQSALSQAAPSPFDAAQRLHSPRCAPSRQTRPANGPTIIICGTGTTATTTAIRADRTSLHPAHCDGHASLSPPGLAPLFWRR